MEPFLIEHEAFPVINGPAVTLSRSDYDALTDRADSAVSILRVLNEETVLAGFPGGDRAQTLANVRSMRAEVERLRLRVADLETGNIRHAGRGN